MAEVFREDFDILADGLAINETNTAFTGSGGDGAIEADTAHSVTGNVSCAFICATATENVRLDDSFTATGTRWFRWYFRPPTPLSLSNQPLIANIASGATSQADVRIENDGTLSIRESLVEVAQTTTAVVPGEWHRLEWAFDGTDQILRLFLPSNVHGTTPDEEISDPYTAGTFDQFSIGPFAQADAWTHHVDSVVADDADWVGPESIRLPFPEDPLDLHVELNLDGTWTDITSFVQRREELINLSRGQSEEIAQPEPSRCRFAVNNRDGRFSPRNPLSPWYGLLGRNTPVRVYVRHGGNVLLSPGVHNRDEIDTPDSAALSITGDIDIRVDLTTRTWIPPTGDFYGLASKWRGSGQGSWLFYLDADGLHLLWSEDGSAIAHDIGSTEPIPSLPGRRALRATLDVDNGFSSNQVTFYTAPDITGPWTQLGSSVVTAGTTSIADGTAAVEVADATAFNVDGTPGRFHHFELRNGLDGVVVADPDFAVPAAGSESFFDSQGNTWTVHGQAEITDKHYRFHGEVSSWPQRWDPSGRDVYATVEAAGILRRLGQGSSALKSAIRRELTSPEAANPPISYWPCEDSQRADSVASALDSGRPMTITGEPRLASDSSFVGSDPLPTMGSALFKGRVPNHDETGEIQVRFLLSVPEDGAADGSIICSIDTTGTPSRRWQLHYFTGDGGDLELRGFDQFDQQVESVGATFGMDGDPARVSIEITGESATKTFAIVVWKVAHISGTVISDTFIGSGGRVIRVSFNPDRDLSDVAFGHVSVHNQVTSIFDLQSLQGHSGETPRERMVRLCGEEGISLQTIGFDEAPWLGPQLPTRLVNLFDEAAASDSGIIFEPRDQLAIGLRAHGSLYNQTPVAELDYTAAHLAGDLEPTDDDQGTRNDVTATAQDGSSSRVVQTEGPLSVRPPPDGVGRYDEDVTVSADHGGFLSHMAGWRVRLGTVDETRYPAIGVNLARSVIVDDPDLVEALLFLDVGDRLTIANPPAWLPPESISQVILGYTETLGNFEHQITLICAPESPWQVAERDQTGNTAARYGTSTSAIGFPEVAGSIGTSFATAATSHPVDMPAIVDADDLLVVLFSDLGDATAPATPSGWTQLFAAAVGASSNYSGFARVADGTEGGTTVDVVTSTATTAAAIAVRITGAHPDISGVAVSAGVNSSGTTPDPDELSTPWATTATLWLATAGWNDDDATVSTFPAEYSGGVDVVSGAGTNAGASVGVAFRSLVAATEDPGPFTLGESEVWQAFTLAVRPEETAVDSTSTSLSVSTTSGPVWTTDASEMPFDIDVGGERMTVTAITGASSPQEFTVTRSVNGVVKSHPVGTAVELFAPAHRAL